jgi:hypothetical protein
MEVFCNLILTILTAIVKESGLLSALKVLE